MRLGIFCGTFNPIHWGHLLMAEFARQQLTLDKVIFITSPNPPHRHSDILDAEQRFDLVSAAVAHHPHFEASRIELERSGTSYTIDTVRHLRGQTPDGSLFLIIGQDNLLFIGKWKEAKEIFANATIVVAPRGKLINKPTDPQEATPLPAEAKIVSLDLPHMDVSSSEIRRRLRCGLPLLNMVPPAVNTILLQRGLYLS